MQLKASDKREEGASEGGRQGGKEERKECEFAPLPQSVVLDGYSVQRKWILRKPRNNQNSTYMIDGINSTGIYRTYSKGNQIQQKGAGFWVFGPPHLFGIVTSSRVVKQGISGHGFVRSLDQATRLNPDQTAAAPATLGSHKSCGQKKQRTGHAMKGHSRQGVW